MREVKQVNPSRHYIGSLEVDNVCVPEVNSLGTVHACWKWSNTKNEKLYYEYLKTMNNITLLLNRNIMI